MFHRTNTISCSQRRLDGFRQINRRYLQGARRGFVRREVVILLALGLILAVLAPILLLSQRSKSRRVFCEQRQTYLVKALQRYHAGHNQLPGWKQMQAETTSGHATSTGWIFPLLPYIGYDPEQHEGPPPPPGFPQLGSLEHLQKTYGPSGADSTRGKPPQVLLPVLLCPAGAPADAAEAGSVCSFVINGGMPDSATAAPPDVQANGMAFNRQEPRFTAGFKPELVYVEAADGASMTLLVAENVDAGLWTASDEALNTFLWSPDAKPEILSINQQTGSRKADATDVRFARPSSYHGGGVNAVFCAGNTQFISQNIAPQVYWRLLAADDTKAATPGGKPAF